VPLYGKAIFSLADFVYSNMQSVGKPGADNRISYLKGLDDALDAEVQALHMQACAWMVRMESNFSSKVWLDEVMTVRANLLIQVGGPRTVLPLFAERDTMRPRTGKIIHLLLMRGIINCCREAELRLAAPFMT